MFFRGILAVVVCGWSSAGAWAADAAPAFTITTVAGGNKAGFSGDGGQGRAAQLNGPSCVALDSKGNAYIADLRNARVRRLRPDGVIETVMGTGVEAFQPGDEARPALQTNLSSPYGLTVDAKDKLYVISRKHSVVYRVGTDGVAHRIAGTGVGGYSGDGGPATQAQIAGGNHLLVNAAGEIFIGDSGNNCVRKIDTAGIITTIAGTGVGGFSGDGGPATAGQFNGISALAFDAAGNMYVADFDNHRIRKVSADGTLSTIAGTGEPKYNSDEIPALQANIGEPCGVVVDAAGVVYIGDQYNRRVRAVTPDGVMHTVAGMGKVGLIGDNGSPALEARLISPDILCLDANGNIYIPDFANHAVRKLTRSK